MRVGIFSDHLAFTKKRGLCVNLLRSILTILWLITMLGRSAFAASYPIADLVESFWFSADDSAVSISNQLKDSAPDLETLYRALKQGPESSDHGPRGQQESFRVDANGTRFPYVFLIP